MKTVANAMTKILGPKKNFLRDESSPESIFLKSFVSAFGPSGHEKPAQDIWKNYVSGFARHFRDMRYGSSIYVVNPDGSISVGGEAHVDEIGGVVTNVTEDGKINISNLGGSNPKVMISQRALIKTMAGELIKGTATWPPPHVEKEVPDDQKVRAEWKNINFDCGFKSLEEAEKAGVFPGCPIVLEGEPFILNDRFYVSKAMDNRIGGFVIAQVGRLLKHMNADVAFYMVNAAQEEVGLKGSLALAQLLSGKLDAMIVTDVCHDSNNPHIDKRLHGSVIWQRGPAIANGPSIHPVFREGKESIYNIGKELKLDPQLYAAAFKIYQTGTDLDSYAEADIVSALISIVLDYMHSTVEKVSIDMIWDVIYLITEVIVRIADGRVKVK